MSELRTDILERFGTAAYQPSTFLERGATVPFTTPFLFGARIRPTDTRVGPEVVIPNPSGGKGCYIVPWNALPEICALTLHDRRMWQRLSEQSAISPTVVREIARGVAAEGLAGRDAAQAVAAARNEDGAARMRTNFLLLLDLIRRAELPGEASIAVEADNPLQIEIRARRAMGRVAPRLGVTPEILVARLESIAGTIAPVGAPGDPIPSRSRKLAQRLAQLADDVTLWVAASPDPGEQHAASLVIDAARLTLTCTDACFAGLDDMLSDSLSLLRAWQDDATDLGRRALRPDWLLDGWHVICDLWQDADPAWRAGVLWEMALLAPVMPREVEQWFDIIAEWQRPASRRHRIVRSHEEWRTGRILDLVARNERLLGRAA